MVSYTIVNVNGAYFAPSTIRIPYELKKIFDRILHELQYLDKVHPRHFTLDLDQLDRIFEYRANYCITRVCLNFFLISSPLCICFY